MGFFCFRRIVNDLLYSHDSRIEISQSFLSKNIAFKNEKRVLCVGNLLPFPVNC